MIKLLFCGVNGRMGKVTSELIESDKLYSERFEIIAGVDIVGAGSHSFPVYDSLDKAEQTPDVIIDFSHHSAVSSILAYAVDKRVPAVICTTGHTEEEIAAMKKAAEIIPVFYSRNMSVGINLLMQLTKSAAQMLGAEFDIEIVEMHHNKKLDAPSGTALMLAEAASEGAPYETEYVYDRHSVRKQRDKREIGIHSVRGGSIVGEHEVIFAGTDEVITLSHSAGSRRVFAAGALRAAEYMADKPAGMYDMEDVVSTVL